MRNRMLHCATITTTTLALLLTVSCTKDQSTHNITNSGTTANSSIAGRVLARSMPVTVEVWRAEKIASVSSDDSGYFSVSKVEPGSCRVVFNSNDAKRLVLDGVVVQEGEATVLKTQYIDIMVIDSIWPYGNLSALDPVWQDKIFSAKCSDEIDLNSLGSALTVYPLVPISVRPDDYYYGDYDVFTVAGLGEFAPHTTYEVTVDTTLISLHGRRLNAIMRMKFTTDSARFSRSWAKIPDIYGYTTWLIDSIVPPDWSPLFVLEFNCPIDTAQFNLACTISAPFAGYWFTPTADYPYDYYYYNNRRRGMVKFFPTNGQKSVPGSSYEITVDGSAPIFIGGEKLGYDLKVRMTTQSVAVTNIRPVAGTTVQSAWYDSPVMTFNARMDTASVRAALEIAKWDGTPVTSPISWSSDLKTFSLSWSSFPTGYSYKISLSTSAKSASGHYLGKPASTFFYTAY